MTVTALIAKLLTVPQDAVVVVAYNGYAECTSVEAITLNEVTDDTDVVRSFNRRGSRIQRPQQCVALEF